MSKKIYDHAEVGLIFGWMALSFYTLFFLQNATAFQRAGAFGVAAIILAFSISSRKLESAKDRLEEFVSSSKAAKEEAAKIQRELSEIGASDSKQRELMDRARSVEIKYEFSLASMPKFESEIQLLFRRISKAEVTSLVIATLQWGYGDLLIPRSEIASCCS